MKKSKVMGVCLAVSMAATCITGPGVKASDPDFSYDFTAMSAVPVYSEDTGSGFESVTTSKASYVTDSDTDTSIGHGRQTADTSEITIGEDGASVTESNGDYITYVNSSNYNYGGLIYRVDTGAPGAYHIEVTAADGSSSSNTYIAPAGMQASRITSTGAWDSAGLVKRKTYAKWSGSVWTYDYVTGEDFIEIEIEPSTKPTEDAPQTVGVKSISITKLDTNAAADKPTVYVLGDSTQKTYTFEEDSMSGWGQVIGSFFDSDKINVVNYSMGGRSMKASYTEGRANDIFVNACAGDYIMIHSAHNDESTGTTSGAQARFGRGSNDELYTNWLRNFYIPALKARGIIPVLVTSMPRTSNGVYKESTEKPNGFKPDSVGIMRETEDADNGIYLAELYAGAKEYIDEIGADETTYIYQSLEAGESPGKTNSGSYANGHPDNKIDGTHYKEAAAKQWSRIIVQSLYDKSIPLADYLSADVKAACASGDWSEVFPEMANDVSTVGGTSQGDNAYYRNQIEKLLQLGIMAKDEDGNFNPKSEMTVGEFAKDIAKAWDIDESVLANYLTAYESSSEEAPTVISAEYENGVLKSISTKTADVDSDGYVTVPASTANAKTFVWDSLLSMVPYSKVNISVDDSTEGDAEGGLWAVSSTSTYTAGQVISDVDGITLTLGNDASGYTATAYNLSDSYTAYVSGKSNPKDANGSGYTTAGANLPTTGCYYVFAPEEDGMLEIAYVLNANKKFYILETDGSTIEAVDGYDAYVAEAKEYTTTKFAVEAGKSYYVFCTGSKLGLFGFEYTPGAVAEPTATPSPTQDPNEPGIVEGVKVYSDAALTRETMAAILYDAYKAKFGDTKPKYMTDYNGTNVSPDDPEYDPNLTGDSAQYYPLVGWNALTDTSSIDDSLYGKAKEAYNLGLVRSESGIARGAMKCGTVFEPKTVVTREKAAKTLFFCYGLAQDIKTENQTLPNGNLAANTSPLVTPNPNAPTLPYEGGTDATPDPDATAAPTAEPTTAPTATPAATPTATPSGELPADKAWTTIDDDLFTTVTSAADSTLFTTTSGLSGYGTWVDHTSSATYTHTNGETYTFTRAWQAGSGSKTRRSFFFTPEQACNVTVAYSSQSGRPVYIYQGSTLLASGEEGTVDGVAAAITADVEDPSKGDVYVYGGSSNKDIFGIFVDYYDPDTIVYHTASGNINYSGSADTSAMKLVFTDTEDSTRYEVAYGTTYSVELRQNRKYDITVEGVEDVCATLDTNYLQMYKKDISYDIDLVDIEDIEVTGEIVSHGLDMTSAALTFTASDDETDVKTATVTAASDTEIPTAEYTYSVVLTPNKKYTVSVSNSDGYTLSELSQSYTLAAGDTTPFKNILLTKDTQAIAYTDTLTVGSDKEYATIREAVAAAENMTDRPSGESGRVTIVIDPGTYAEQVTINGGYITLQAADETDKPIITWHYGIGYLYYSAGDDGYYSEDAYVQRTDKGTVSRWGCTVRVVGTNFLAENIIFENSFNCRVTDTELSDGVTAAEAGWYSDVSGKPDRTASGFDAKARNSVERAAAMATDRGANSEFYGCEFISSQDTLYTGGNSYFKECYIEGGTDYIFGGNSVLFEDCTLAWHGYSDQAVGGYLTACKTSDTPTAGTANLNANGYLFRNTTVTTSKYYTDNKFAAGAWGRNWGGANCQVIFEDTTMDGVDTPGSWVKMGGDLSLSILYVDGVTDKDGNTVDTSSTVYNPNGTMSDNGYTVLSDTDYFGGVWVPKHYSGTVELDEYTTTWYFGKSNGAESYALEGTGGEADIVGTTNSPETQTLHVDATAGKFNNASRTDEWAQVNAGTVFTIPVADGSVITIDSYSSEVLSIDETELSEASPYTYSGDAGTVTATVTTGGYLAGITVVSPAQ